MPLHGIDEGIVAHGYQLKTTFFDFLCKVSIVADFTRCGGKDSLTSLDPRTKIKLMGPCWHCHWLVVGGCQDLLCIKMQCHCNSGCEGVTVRGTERWHVERWNAATRDEPMKPRNRRFFVICARDGRLTWD